MINSRSIGKQKEIQRMNENVKVSGRERRKGFPNQRPSVVPSTILWHLKGLTGKLMNT